MSHNSPAALGDAVDPNSASLLLHHLPFHPLSFLGTMLEQMEAGWVVVRCCARDKKEGGRGGKDPAGLRRGHKPSRCVAVRKTPLHG